MPKQTAIELIEWIGLNVLSLIYVVKDWLIGVLGIEMLSINIVGVDTELVDVILRWAIGLSIFAFNVVRIFRRAKK